MADDKKTVKNPCDNHPDREGKHFTQKGAVDQRLCDECAPEWYKE